MIRRLVARLFALGCAASLGLFAPLAAQVDAFVDPAARLAEVDAALPKAEPVQQRRLAGERIRLLLQLDRLDDAASAITALEAQTPADEIDTQATLALDKSLLSAQRQQLMDAEKWARLALDRFKQAAGPDSAETAVVTTNLAKILISQSKLEEGVPLAAQAWERMQALARPGDSERIDAGFQYAVGLVYSGQTREAETVLRSLLAELPALPQGHLMRAKLPEMLGTDLLMQGRSGEAIGYLTQAVEAGQHSTSLILGERADHLSVLGIALLMQDRPAEALPVFEQAIALFGEADALPSQSGAYLNAGTAADRAGDRAKGLEYREKGMEIAASMGDQHPLAVALNQFKLAQSLAHAGRLEEAETMEQAAVTAIAGFRPESHFQNTNSRIALGWIKALRGDPGAGLALVKPAFETSWATYVENEIAQNRTIDVLSDVEAYSQALETARLAHDPDFAFKIMQIMIESDASRAALAVASREEAGGSALGELLRQRQEAGAAVASADSALLKVQATGEGDLAGAQSDLSAAKAVLASVESELDSRFPEFRTLLRPRIVTIAEMQAALGPDEALLVIDESDLGIYTMAITHEGWAIGVDPLRRQPLRELVSGIRQGIDAALLGADDAPFDVAGSARLYRAVFTPDVAALVQGKRELRIATGDILSALPLSLLVSKPGKDYRDSRYLIDDKAISIVPSLAALAEEGSAPESTQLGRLVAIGAPLLSGRAAPAAGPSFFEGGRTRSARVAELEPLPGAEREMRALASALAGEGQPVILSGAAATEQAVDALDLSNVGVLLFATHGLVAGAFDARSEPALVLTPPAEQQGDDDGLLTASEAARLHIDAQWVILSACDTAAGGRPSAAGYTGLARGFLFAGARRVVASHWAVRDDIAAELSERIVAAARAGKSPGEALREAALAVRKSESHPAFWAPFMVVAR